MTTRKHQHGPHEAELRAEAEPAAEPRSAAPLEAKIAELEAALAEAKDRHLRLAADFDNYKKRSRQEHLETIQHASADLIARLLPGLDD
ncbi:MAG TPA: nucleotide exchange factor GrpE, partial [Candidatus Acidoferrum sp.]|nr:nucleotide exchange factor GrpE [Candidatus Acidoferrum sp.]